MCLIFATILIILIAYFFKRKNQNKPINSDEVWEKTTKTLEDFKKLMDDNLSSGQAEPQKKCAIESSIESTPKKECLESIQAEAEARSGLIEAVLSQEIEELVHFTRIENLPSILSTGLQNRIKLKETSQEFLINDTMRFDNRLNGISLSITHPNQSMFYKYRMASQSDNWCVIVLNPSILWELNCLYCRHNAADSRISRLNDDTLSNKKSFLSMFSCEERNLSLPKNHTTDVQAEVLCLNEIPVEYIDRIAVLDINSIILSNIEKTTIEVVVDRNYFNTREYNISLLSNRNQ
jgi:hypothetical protein